MLGKESYCQYHYQIHYVPSKARSEIHAMSSRLLHVKLSRVPLRIFYYVEIISSFFKPGVRKHTIFNPFK